jgi:hypothetical protein
VAVGGQVTEQPPGEEVLVEHVVALPWRNTTASPDGVTPSGGRHTSHNSVRSLPGTVANPTSRSQRGSGSRRSGPTHHRMRRRRSSGMRSSHPGPRAPARSTRVAPRRAVTTAAASVASAAGAATHHHPTAAPPTARTTPPIPISGANATAATLGANR